MRQEGELSVDMRMQFLRNAKMTRTYPHDPHIMCKGCLTFMQKIGFTKSQIPSNQISVGEKRTDSVK